MKVDIPFNIGDKITVDNEKHTVKGIHIYIGKDGSIYEYRLHIGSGKFVTIKSCEVLKK